MRRYKVSYAVDLAFRNEAAGGAVPIPAAAQDASLVAPAQAFASHAFASQVLSLMESQTKALQDIAGAMGQFAEKLSVTLPAQVVTEGSPVAASGENYGELRDEISALREQMRAAESVHQNDLEQLRKWLTRLGEAMAGK